MIYALGSNGQGQLGLGHTEDVSTPEKVKLPKQYENAALRRIVAGGNHTLFHFEDGTVVSAGGGEDTSIVSLVVDGEKHDRFADVSATWLASYFVTLDRRSIIVTGSGNHGELGLGEGVVAISMPTIISFSAPIKTISSCLAHTFVILDDGSIWGWGKGRKGQLGEPRLDCWTPRRIAGIDITAETVVCGSDFTLFIADREDGRLMMLGCDAKDRFGLRSGMPVSIAGWEAVSASWGGIAVQMDDRIIAWGRDDRGQRVPSNLPPLQHLALGSEHWLALTKTGEVLTGGWGEHGNCGTPTGDLGVVKHRWNVLETGHTVKQVYAGCATSFLDS